MCNNVATFDYFWKQSIMPAISLCRRDYDDNVMTEIDFKECDLESYRRELEQLFVRKLNWLKHEYLPRSQEPILDFHKLSAILCRCIIGNKFFSYDKNKAKKIFSQIQNDKFLSNSEKLKWQIDNIYINYKLAFWSSVGLAFVDLFNWAKEKRDSLNLEIESDESKNNVYIEFQKKLNKENLRIYKKSNTHDDYVTSVIVSLMKNDMLMRDFDYLLFATSMFQWQEHTKYCFFIEILLDPTLNQGYTISDLNSFI